MGASINKGGKNDDWDIIFTSSLAIHFVGGGLYAPMPEDLKKVRQEIDYSFDEFKGSYRQQNSKLFMAI